MVKLHDVLFRYKEGDSASIQQALAHELKGLNKKIVVLDDDPTGVQTVHDVSVYTSWDVDSLRQGFAEDNAMFFILTNSRGFTSADAKRINEEIARNIATVVKDTGQDFIVISRGDSTMRGHYPIETQTLRDTLEYELLPRYDGEIICPFFIEGGRYTDGDVHYVKYGDDLVPAGETEFAQDKTFGYHSSDIKAWVEEKTNGAYKAADVRSVSIDMLRAEGGADAVYQLLMSVSGFGKVVVNALSYDDVRVFCTGFAKAVKQGQRFLLRTAAAVPKILGGVSDKPLLTRAELVTTSGAGGLVVVGSHVKKTSEQLEHLREVDGVRFIEFDQHTVLDPAAFQNERERVQAECNRTLKDGVDVAIYTRRERLDLNTGDKEKELKLATDISDAVTGFVANLDVQPSYIIAKGGITSSDIGTIALRVKRATVMGQVLPGIPVWMTGDESKFPHMPYIIFPGNVGEPDSLKVIVESLKQ